MASTCPATSRACCGISDCACVDSNPVQSVDEVTKQMTLLKTILFGEEVSAAHLLVQT